jgi:hypothetical protein
MAAALDWLRANWLLVAILVGLALAFFFLRTSPTAGMDSLATLDGSLKGGRPTVLEFYSNF